MHTLKIPRAETKKVALTFNLYGSDNDYPTHILLPCDRME